MASHEALVELTEGVQTPLYVQELTSTTDEFRSQYRHFPLVQFATTSLAEYVSGETTQSALSLMLTGPNESLKTPDQIGDKTQWPIALMGRGQAQPSFTNLVAVKADPRGPAVGYAGYTYSPNKSSLLIEEIVFPGGDAAALQHARYTSILLTPFKEQVYPEGSEQEGRPIPAAMVACRTNTRQDVIKLAQTDPEQLVSKVIRHVAGILDQLVDRERIQPTSLRLPNHLQDTRLRAVYDQTMQPGEELSTFNFPA